MVFGAEKKIVAKFSYKNFLKAYTVLDEQLLLYQTHILPT